MNKNAFLAVTAAFLVGCAAMGSTPPAPRETCNTDQNKQKDLKIAYGDGFIDVDYYTRASKRDNKTIVVQLKPKQSAPRLGKYGASDNDGEKGSGKDFRDLPIIIRGKTRDAADIIDVVMVATDPVKYRTICLENKPEGRYRFLVHVPGVGTIDPIVDIIP